MTEAQAKTPADIERVKALAPSRNRSQTTSAPIPTTIASHARRRAASSTTMLGSSSWVAEVDRPKKRKKA